MKYAYILGVDPGAHGAIAIADPAGRLVMVDDMPTVKRKRGKRMATEVAVEALARLLEPTTLHTVVAYVERVGARPGQGVSSMFAFGRAVGQAEGALAALSIPVKYVAPQVWRRDVGAGHDKQGSRRRAQELFPGDRATFARVKDDGRADAALIAWWGCRRERGAS